MQNATIESNPFLKDLFTTEKTKNHFVVEFYHGSNGNFPANYDTLQLLVTDNCVKYVIDGNDGFVVWDGITKELDPDYKNSLY